MKLNACPAELLQLYFSSLFRNIFRHLKLEIALAIPASNDEKYYYL